MKNLVAIVMIVILLSWLWYAYTEADNKLQLQLQAQGQSRQSSEAEIMTFIMTGKIIAGACGFDKVDGNQLVKIYQGMSDNIALENMCKKLKEEKWKF